MSKKNLFLPEVKNNTSRSSFDLSRRVISSAKCGEILPCFVEDILPGDSITINPHLFTRLANLNTSNFARINQYVNFYFVPYRLLYRDFNTFAVNRKDAAKQASSITSQHDVPLQLPHVHSDVLDELLNGGAKSVEHDSFSVLHSTATQSKPNAITLAKGTLNVLGINRFDNALKLMQYLGYYELASVKNPLRSVTSKPTLLNLFPLLAYQKVYCDFYRFQQWETDQPNTYNVDYLSGSNSMDIPIRNLFGTSRGYVRNASGGLVAKDFTVFNSLEDTMFDLRFVNAIKDTLFGVVPSAQFGAASTVTSDITKSSKRDVLSLNSVMLVSEGGPKSGTPASYGVHTTPSGDYDVLGFDFDKASYNGLHSIYSASGEKTLSQVLDGIQTSFTIANLRAAQALQKFREVSFSNDSDYKSQIEAHFGVKVSSLMSCLCDYLGGFSAQADISTVTNTNLEGADSVANYSAIGSMQGKSTEINFTAREHGIIIGVSYVLPLIDVQPIGYDVSCLRTEFEDFAMPEFDRLGNEEVDPRLFLGTRYTDKSHLGYGPRYYDYKTKYDIVLGDFNASSGGTQPNFVVNFNDHLLPTGPASELISSFVKKDIYRSILDGTVNAWDFKIRPCYLNNIFNVMVGNGHDDFSFDQFYNVFDFTVKCVRNLSYDGMPY